jgi:hypothetical protein
MNRTWIRCGAVVLAFAVVAFALVILNRGQPAANAQQQADKPASGPHYTVVETEGTNLVVTDNATNTLYFYTVDKGQPPGSDLKLRGSLDLKDVGKPTLKPKDVNIQK